ncbi:MAG: exosortase-associated EpsI family protein [Planctomycetes bacterium]|nr:exosortase-associated EpsI family protein [Planctomycetota bacterium]
MIRMLLPAVLALVAIVSLSFYEGYAMKDRWSEPGIEAKELSERFAKVPLNIGEWEGEDLPVDEVVRKTAGAIGYVSRRYTNVTTGKTVVLWLIVGHSRDITRHTPNICYPSSGFRQTGSQVRHLIELSDGTEANFYTAKFEKEDAFSRNKERVFWTFNHPGANQWEAPEEGPRWRYGLAKALYKLYFTSTVQADEEVIDHNVATEFAEIMLPAIDKALFPTEEATTSEATPAADAEVVQ